MKLNLIERMNVESIEWYPDVSELIIQQNIICTQYALEVVYVQYE